MQDSQLTPTARYGEDCTGTAQKIARELRSVLQTTDYDATTWHRAETLADQLQTALAQASAPLVELLRRAFVKGHGDRWCFALNGSGLSEEEQAILTAALTGTGEKLSLGHEAPESAVDN